MMILVEMGRAESDGKGVLIRWLGGLSGGVIFNTTKTSVRPVRNKLRKASWGW